MNSLGLSPATFAMKTFSNKETAVEIGVSVRDDNVFIIQSGSDSVRALMGLRNRHTDGTHSEIGQRPSDGIADSH